MITYVNTNPGDSIRLHDVLRVTFAETPSFLVPDDVASANLASDVGHLIRSMEDGGYAVAPVSDTTVAPGAQAVTIDFMVPGQGTVTVAQAVQQLTGGLFGVLEFVQATEIVRVERITGAEAGAPGAGVERGATAQTVEEQLSQTTVGATLASFFGKATTGLVIIAVIAGVFVFAPEIKAALRASRGRS